LEINYNSISGFIATGFFFGQESYFKNKPAEIHPLQKFLWKYEPKDVSFLKVVEEFEYVFKTVSEKIFNYDKIIIPLSGGLDSRTQATFLLGHQNVNVQSYTYQFNNGIGENKFGKRIAQKANFKFKEYNIAEGYLWSKLDKLAECNKCETEFTHPRQMAVDEKLSDLGDVFFLGHWGDVLFDSVDIDSNAGEEEQLLVLKEKIIKKGGFELAESIWKVWDLPESFSKYLDQKLFHYLSKIKIDHAGARIRAFKSLHWLPRWTLANLCVFEQHHPLILPYCDTRMFDFVCSVPEEFLSGRKIQIEYIKHTAPELAKIPWQPYYPFDLTNYEKFKSISNWPRRGWKKTKRIYKEKFCIQHKITKPLSFKCILTYFQNNRYKP